MDKLGFKTCWQRFLHWKGWKQFAGFWIRLWKGMRNWTGWKRVFGIPVLLVLLLSVLCGAGLVYVFTQGLEQWFPAYLLYAVSAYTLIALCVKIPCTVRSVKKWLAKHPKIAGVLKNEEILFALELYFEQFINFTYGIFKIISGVVIGSAWIGADGIYNLTQALIQLFQILRRRKPGSMEAQWRAYRNCGGLVLLMHLTLTGIVFQMVNWNRAEDYAGYLIFATAAFAFYKIISSFFHVAKDRKHRHPIDSSVRMLELSQAIFAMFSLQASLLHTFGTNAPWEHTLNIATGCTVCLLIMAMGIYMIRRGSREIRNIQEASHG